MGLQAHWLRVAEEIGVDAFLAMWRVLDAEPSMQPDLPGRPLRMVLRRYRSYLRYQRNRYIEALVADGVALDEIRVRIERELCERVSLKHITRLGNRA